MTMPRPALLVLEDGSCFQGISFGYYSDENGNPVHAVGEVVFNTAMTGYQEILTDPSYAGQFITLTYPHIGNTGINTEDNESHAMYAKGLIIRDLPRYASNWRKEISLDAFLLQNKTLGIAQIDTRRLTRILREKGALKGCIYSAAELDVTHVEKALRYARAATGLAGRDLAIEVTTKEPYIWQEGGNWPPQNHPRAKNWHVVAYDFGIKKTILRCLEEAGCRITVVPATTSAEAVLALAPDGVFLSNGPGDPEPCTYAITAIQALLDYGMPLFGICLGHQLLALACHAKTFKMKCGHHGGNHPVRAINVDKVLITSQNHGFAVEEASLPATLEITHRSLFDNTIQGIRHKTKPMLGFQGHPEAGPGPSDARYLFEEFISMMQHYKNHTHTMQKQRVHSALVES